MKADRTEEKDERTQEKALIWLSGESGPWGIWDRGGQHSERPGCGKMVETQAALD